MIPVCAPVLGKKELQYVTDCIKTNWISSRGKYIGELEKKFARYCGCKYGIATTSGTTALHLALVALGIGRGDEVILPNFTMIATAFAVMYTGAHPVLVDADKDTYCIDVEKIESKIGKKTKLILPVHMYGHPCDMGAVLKIARKHKLLVIEDAAEAHGAEYKGKRVGGLSDAGCFSFYANKIITCGEGGMVVTNNKKIARRASLLKDLAFSPKKRFLHLDLGFNYRLTNLQAALALAQFERIDDFIRMRRKNAALYKQYLSGIKGLRLSQEAEWAKNVYWMYAVLVEPEFGISRDELMRALYKRGVETRRFFIPLHEQPVFKKMGMFLKGRYPVSEELSRKGMYLPSGSGLKEKEIAYVAKILRKIKHG